MKKSIKQSMTKVLLPVFLLTNGIGVTITPALSTVYA